MEKVKFDDVLKYEQPTKYLVETENYNESYDTPVLTAGKSFLLGYTNEQEGIYKNIPSIIFDDFTTSFHFVDFPFKVKSSALKILKNVEDKADLKYLFYKMQTIKFQPEQHKRYWISKYSQFEIPLPTLNIQKKMAARLDKAQEIIRYNEEIIAKYDQLTQSLFLDMFGDPVKNEMGWEKNILGNNIKTLTDYHANGSYESLKEVVTLKDEEDYALMVRTTDLENDNFNKDVKYISEEAYNFLSKSKVYGGEIIMNKIGSAGNIYLMPKLNKPVSLGMNAFLIRIFEEKLNIKFVFFLLKTEFGENEIKKRIKGAVTKTIKKDAVREIPIFLPPISLQNQFAERIQKIEAQKQLAQESLAKSQELFQSLLQESFK